MVSTRSRLQEVTVAGSVARVTEISAKSDTSFEDAVKIGLDRANSTLRGVTSAWVKEQSVEVSDGQISGYRVNLLVTFVLD
jgi:flavin-binding protein dodecin